MDTAHHRNKVPGAVSTFRRRKCAQLFFVFPGARRAATGHNPLYLLLHGLGNRNLAFIRDAGTDFFDNGISDELPTLDSVVEWQLDHITRLDGVQDVYCLGTSSGGYAAIMFGHVLGANEVFAIAPTGPKRVAILRDLLTDWNGITDYHIYYSPTVEMDRRFAETLAECPHVILHPSSHPMDNHMLMRQMANRGDLEAIFPPFLGVET